MRNCSKIAVETVYEPNPGYNYRSVNGKVSRTTALGALIETLTLDKIIYGYCKRNLLSEK